MNFVCFIDAIEPDIYIYLEFSCCSNPKSKIDLRVLSEENISGTKSGHTRNIKWTWGLSC